MVAWIMLASPPPKPRPQPIPRRLPQRKRMTIALGMLVADAVVIAADTQEGTGYAGGTKASGRKIFTQVDPTEQRAFSATGAGDADYLDTLSQDLAGEFVAAADHA